ncbi:MAG: 30S ribosome-binding factor RbfA [Deltaproteobacteria bacterium]|nr:30S ribosome-binding factor RbfA [Deltaproteobacteria bacterium]MBW2477913.1 30S ribosome-binding factor RbfA [Deltaproteobacteria bacterium]MBW2502965.1 30S ribosome-binding factor RbfA [Deltaproteobacteria bacterium]MBW2519862.1 30S ribosome-binding factor RbfA [Deltaproteobacteria bacterium]
MTSPRCRRVAETIHHEISQLLIKGLKDPRIGFITITAVDVSPDLRHAKVFYTLIGNETDRKNTAAGLKSSTSYVRQQLGRQLRMKYIPDIHFEYDSSVEYGNHIEDLLREIKPSDDS